jgi:ferrochelatase
MTAFRGESGFRHDAPAAIGVLVSNLGTPAAPTAAALRPYLKQFLSDPRVIELPRALWWVILHLFVLTRRPAASARLYRSIWSAEGSPLLTGSRRLAAGLAARLAGRARLPIRVALGMRYGEPAIASALAELAAAGCRRLLVLPLYPQYSAATVASTFDAVFAELATWRWVPELRTVAGWHDQPGYVAALAASIRELWQREGESERLMLSFHGTPRRYFEAGDPYFCCCQKTARLVAERLALAPERLVVSFQSRFGREEWLRPYTDETVAALAKGGVRSLDVVSPAFAVDCLETLEELDKLNRGIFTGAGGERFRYIPCLNDRADHLDFLAELVTRHLGGWLEEPRAPGEEDLGAVAARRVERARDLAARLPGWGAGSAPG